MTKFKIKTILLHISNNVVVYGLNRSVTTEYLSDSNGKTNK